jgi:putrescine aminotransferase
MTFAASPTARAAAQHPAMLAYGRHVNPAFVRLLGVLGYARVFVRGQGTTLIDHQGGEYLDFLAGFGTFNLGHSHPRLIARLRDFLLEAVPNVLHTAPQPLAAELAQKLAERTGGELTVALFCSSGGEAVEAGLKLARAASRRRPLLYCAHGYHGNSLGALAVMGERRYQTPFEPLLPECQAIPFGDIDALERALRKLRPAAFVVEPLQAEGGIVLPPAGYLKQAQELCKRHQTLLILDEVQTGIGRTGSLFLYQQEGFTPDVLILAKALGGGMLPTAVALARRELFERAYGTAERFDLHGSTMAGNALACAAGLATLEIVDDEQLCARAAAQGERLRSLLKARLGQHPLVREVRGRGLLVGIELGPNREAAGLLARAVPGLVGAVARNVFGQWLAVRMLERGIVAQPTSHRWDVLRLEPPLTVSAAEIDRAVETIAAILDEYRDLGRLLRDVAERLGGQYLSRWSA